MRTTHPLTAEERQQIELFAKEFALTKFKKTHNPEAAWRLVERHWRDDEFVVAACECIAIFRALDEKEAAPNN